VKARVDPTWLTNRSIEQHDCESSVMRRRATLTPCHQATKSEIYPCNLLTPFASPLSLTEPPSYSRIPLAENQVTPNVYLQQYGVSSHPSTLYLFPYTPTKINFFVLTLVTYLFWQMLAAFAPHSSIYLLQRILRKVILLTFLRFIYFLLQIVYLLQQTLRTLWGDYHALIYLYYKTRDPFKSNDSTTCHLRTIMDEIASGFVSYVMIGDTPCEKILGIHLAEVSEEDSNLELPTGMYKFPNIRDLSFAGENDEFNPEEDIILVPADFDQPETYGNTFTAYKSVDKKIKPVSGTFPEAARVHRHFPHNPLDGMPQLPTNPQKFVPNSHMTEERMKILNINSTGFLWPEEEKLFQQVMILNQGALAFEEVDRGTFSESYFSPYIIPTVPHTPWEYRNIPIPPGIKDKVIELLKHKHQWDT
jgi:hypothetical protein